MNGLSKPMRRLLDLSGTLFISDFIDGSLFASHPHWMTHDSVLNLLLMASTAMAADTALNPT